MSRGGKQQMHRPEEKINAKENRLWSEEVLRICKVYETIKRYSVAIRETVVRVGTDIGLELQVQSRN